jgi:hypothetical protein
MPRVSENVTYIVLLCLRENFRRVLLRDSFSGACCEAPGRFYGGGRIFLCADARKKARFDVF